MLSVKLFQTGYNWVHLRRQGRQKSATCIANDAFKHRGERCQQKWQSKDLWKLISTLKGIRSLTKDKTASSKLWKVTKQMLIAIWGAFIPRQWALRPLNLLHPHPTWAWTAWWPLNRVVGLEPFKAPLPENHHCLFDSSLENPFARLSFFSCLGTGPAGTASSSHGIYQKPKELLVILAASGTG